MADPGNETKVMTGIPTTNTTADAGASAVTPQNKVAAQLTKLRDANTKYKNLLKMAKERIEHQEQELKRFKEAESQRPIKAGQDDAIGMGDEDESGELTMTIVRIWQRIKVELAAHELNSKGGNEEIWALMEFESYDPDQQMTTPPKRTKKWKKFDSEAELSDYIRRDTGEPLAVPSYSLTPQQSADVQAETKKQVSQITEEFRRFRVKSEMSRKQADAQIRELQNSNVESAKRRIEGAELSGENDPNNSRSESSKIERMRAEMTRQEAQWKEAYDILMEENNSLKSSGSEAMLASQWRKRYEACLKEKEEIENKMKASTTYSKSELAEAPEKYEMKYRDLKESFRLYRKKAKEIFEAQQAGLPNTEIYRMSEKSNEESKLSYLKNLMLNYLTSDSEVREHMEMAIGTVLQFTPEDLAKIEEKKNEAGYFGIF